MKTDELNTWRAFHGVAIHGSFSKAAEALRISVPQLSKRVSRLEELLGVRLFSRTTRVVRLTSEGKSILPKVNAVLDDFAGLEASFDGKQELSGLIRVTSVPFVAHRLLIPVLSDFMSAHPGVRIELDLSESMLNLVESGIDIAIRIHDEPEDSSLIYRKLASNDLVFCASPRYLRRAEAPLKRLSDLKDHPMLMLSVHGDCRVGRQSHRLGDLAVRKRVVCENGWFLTELALSGAGVLVRSVWDVKDHLKKGSLVQVLEKHSIEAFGNVYAVIPSRKYLAPRVRAFLDFVVERISSEVTNSDGAE